LIDAVSATGLVKRYRQLPFAAERCPAVNGLDLTIPEGGITGLLGPNGAGKTTAIKLLLGLVRPTAGSATVLGFDARRESLSIRERVAFVPAERAIFGWMRVSEFLPRIAQHSVRWDDARAERLLTRWEIDRRARLRELSSGTRSRLFLLVALARGASLLLLDEPTTGLDPKVAEDALSELAVAAADGATVVLATHRLDEVERICDRVVVMAEGRAVLQADLDDLRAGWRAIEVGPHPIIERLATWEEVAVATRVGDRACLLVHAGADAVVDRLRLLGAEATSVRPLSLREIYLAVTRADPDDADRDDLA
jgi:ABC-2 type transport system ATP-binding protein